MSKIQANKSQWRAGDSVPASRSNGFQGQGLLAALARAPRALIELLIVWQERARWRQQLGELDERLLHDIGLSRQAIDTEVRKPFWRA